MDAHPFLSIVRELGDFLSVHQEGVSTDAAVNSLTANIYPFADVRTNVNHKEYEGQEVYISDAEITATLNSAITASSSTIAVNSGTSFAASSSRPYVIGIDSEYMLVTLAANSFTVASGGRGWAGTRAAAHAASATVYGPARTPNPNGIASANATTGVITPAINWSADPGGAGLPFDIFKRGVSIWDLRKATNIALRNLRYRSEFPLTLVADGDMRANGITNWTASNATVTKVTNSNVIRGPRSLRVLATSATGYAQSDTIFVDPTNSREWFVDVFVRADVGTARLVAYDVTNSANITTWDWTARGWGRLGGSFTLPATCEALAFLYMSVASSDDSYWSAGCHYPQGAREVPLPSWLQNKGDVLCVLDDTADLDRHDEPRWRRHFWWDVKEDPSNPNNPFRLHLNPATYGPIWIEAIRAYDPMAADAQTAFCDLEWLKTAASVEICKTMIAKSPSEAKKHFEDLLYGNRRGQGLLHELKVMNGTRLPALYTSQFSQAY